MSPVATGDMCPAATGDMSPVATGDMAPGATGHMSPVATGGMSPVATGHRSPVATGHMSPVATSEDDNEFQVQFRRSAARAKQRVNDVSPIWRARAWIWELLTGDKPACTHVVSAREGKMSEIAVLDPEHNSPTCDRVPHGVCEGDDSLSRDECSQPVQANKQSSEAHDSHRLPNAECKERSHGAYTLQTMVDG